MQDDSLRNNIDRYRDLADQGASSFQCFLASAIIADINYPNRMVEVLKWILISKMLGDQLAHDSIVDFLTRGMSAIDVESSFLLVENWIKEKIEIAHNPKTDLESLNWTSSLREIVGIYYE